MHDRLNRFLKQLDQHALIMGILNLTPDSFSDGGKFNSFDAALTQARRMKDEGAHILDIGAESTRPGHTPISADEEWARLEPLLKPLVDAVDIPFSIDTYKAEVARKAVDAGVSIINDIWGLQRDPAMADTVAETGAGVVIMHNRDSVDPTLDIVDDMHRFFDVSLQRAEKAGIPANHIMLDPGIGFGKDKAQNLAALRGLPALAGYKLPLLLGVSRKSLFGQILGSSVDNRLIATLSANLTGSALGASIFRVHDVAEHVAAFKVQDAIINP